MRVRNDTERSSTSCNDDNDNKSFKETKNSITVTDPLLNEDTGGTNGSIKPQMDYDGQVEINIGKLESHKGTSIEDKDSDNAEDVEKDAVDGEDDTGRAAWGGKLEFLFTCIGYAVGLGNVWRFPYLCYKNGGGAFLIPYVIMLAFVGLPLFFMELAFGQFASLGPITIWKINPLLKGLGYAMVSVSWLIAVYYNVIISHVLLYLFASFAAIPTGLPWVSCNNWWNTPNCLEPVYDTGKNLTNATSNGTVGTTSSSVIQDAVTKSVSVFGDVFGNKSQTPAEEYYNHFVLEISDGIEHANGVNWKLALCLLLSWIIVLICLIKGITSLGKVVYFTAIFPYIMLTILLIRGVTLPGAGKGILYYLKPDFSRLSDPRVWSDAATQIFYSLSACSGGLIAMSSYNKFDNNCYKDSLIVALINCGTSIYGGFVIFSILGFMAVEKGVEVKDVAQGGPGLAFVVYPEALSRMPAPQLWAIFFFFMMATLGFGSQFSIVECVLSAFTDEFNHILKNPKASILFRVCVIMFTFLMGLPMVTRGGIYLLDLVDYSVSGFPLLFVGLLECGCLAWFYGYERFAGDIELMLGHKPNLYWKICWMGLTPAIIIVTIIFNCIFYKDPSYGDSYTYPGWAIAMGWMIGLFPVFLIVIFFVWRYCRDGGFVLVREIGKPKMQWGPLISANRKGTIYEDDIIGTSELSPPWRYDAETQTFIFPHTINLGGQTPSGSMYNIANVQNYTGPIPVILNIPNAKELGIDLPKISNSCSMNDLGFGGIKGGRASTRSVPHLPILGVSQQQHQKHHFASMAHLATKTASSVASLSHSMTNVTPDKKKSPLADEPPSYYSNSGAVTPVYNRSRTGSRDHSAPNSGANTPYTSRSRTGSKASTHIYLSPEKAAKDHVESNV